MILLLLFASQVGGSQVDVPDPSAPNCEAVDTVGMIECNKRVLTTWENRLNDEYKEALGRVGTVSREKLRQSQRIWLQYRAANCSIYESHGGTIHFILGSGCMIRMTRERTSELGGFDAAFE